MHIAGDQRYKNPLKCKSITSLIDSSTISLSFASGGAPVLSIHELLLPSGDSYTPWHI